VIALGTFALGCLCALSWAANQAAVPEQHELPCEEPERTPAAPVTLVLVASDGGQLSERIDRTTGGHGYSHCYLDVGHQLPDGERLVLDYQPGAGVHYAYASVYGDRPVARVRLLGNVGQQVYGCIRSRLGQPFDAAGLLVGRTTVATCAGLVWGCLPPRVRCGIGGPGRPISPNDYALFFGATVGETVDYEHTEAA
jgi:hypothetical protein